MRWKRFKLVPEMEGTVAQWYARQRGTQRQIESFRKQAVELTAGLPSGTNVLEIAPGPGYLAVAIAQLGRCHVTGLDISRTFVEIAKEKAREAGVKVEFRHGDVANVPFDSNSFDLIVCQAAFKNFTQPVRALDEMHRVLRVGGTVVIQDLSKDASSAEIEGDGAQSRQRVHDEIRAGDDTSTPRLLVGPVRASRRRERLPDVRHQKRRDRFGGAVEEDDRREGRVKLECLADGRASVGDAMTVSPGIVDVPPGRHSRCSASGAKLKVSSWATSASRLCFSVGGPLPYIDNVAFRLKMLLLVSPCSARHSVTRKCDG
jgi:ubiquinone/menaquinone biosynthesis C-methylase UbiE